MRCQLTDDVEAYAVQAGPLLEAEPVANNVALTVIEGARAGRYDDALFACVEDSGGVVVGAASHTPPFSLLLPLIPMAAVDAVCDRLLEVGHRLPGVSGPVEQTARFADRWSRSTGVRVRLHTSERLYRLAQLSPPTGVPGALRRAVAADLDLVADWITAFARDVGHSHLVDPGQDARRRVDDGQVHLWEADGRVVSMAANSYPVAGVVRIGPVYTPPDLRQRGYAGASVAELSRRLLDAGSRECMLYTDRANPTSNSVYQRIGYRPALDTQQLVFAELPAASSR